MKAVNMEMEVQRLASPRVFPIPHLDSDDAFCQQCQKNANGSFLAEKRNERMDQAEITSWIWKMFRPQVSAYKQQKNTDKLCVTLKMYFMFLSFILSNHRKLENW